MKKIIIFITLFTLLTELTLYSQWTQQNFPNPNNIEIYDIGFLNKDTGFVALNANEFFRTTNGGTNWDSIANYRIYTLEVINSTTIYGLDPDGTTLIRTFDGGTTWNNLGASAFCYMSFVNKDTGWFAGLSGIYKTTNAGVTAQFISSNTTCGKIQMLKEPFNGEHYGYTIESGSGAFRKTTNSGLNWINIPTPIPGGNWNSIFFLNKDTGWSYLRFGTGGSRFIFTSDGGVNWITQFVDINSHTPKEIYFNNLNKGWASNIIFEIWATSNSGVTWGTQSVPLFSANDLSFVDSLLGWCGTVNIAYTTNGGGVITYIGVDTNNTKIQMTFILKQNYPNPFNPQTTIELSISKNSNVSLTIYDITGIEILKLYDKQNLVIGNYKAVIDFGKLNVSSGIYLYTLEVTDSKSKEVYKKTKKMSFVK